LIVSILTLFPSALDAYLRESVLRIAQEKGLVRFRLVDLRDFTTDRHRTVDDRPFGGGPGMVLKPEPVFAAVEEVESSEGPHRKVLLTPDGRRFDQRAARDFAREERLLLLCGRYEGFDERIRIGLAWDEVSLGDFVLAGGEVAALALVEATVRLVPGVLGDPDSARFESFEEGRLDYPQYTRPRSFRGMDVPEVLLSGDHEAVRRWREQAARERTIRRRPDLGPPGAGSRPGGAGEQA
jgi:tRNA (guanine37-N1)-methyltransferase